MKQETNQSRYAERPPNHRLQFASGERLLIAVGTPNRPVRIRPYVAISDAGPSAYEG